MKTLFLSALLALPVWGAKTLDIYFVDVEGGQATLVVTPAGESMLVDTGWPGFESRDANRIADAAKKAGVSKIDYLVITHFHPDHVGGIKQLSDKMPIAHVVDHGDNVETGDVAARLNKLYAEVVAKSKRITVKAGDTLPLKGLKVEIVAANGVGTTRPGKPNPLCASVQKGPDDPTENARSVGTLLTMGKFRLLNLGDLTWNKELELVCPDNRLGKVDVYLTTHHGADTSGVSALVHAIEPKVAIMNNGEKKGGSPAAWKTIKASPGLKDLWQLHYSAAGGSENNIDEKFVANTAGQESGNYLLVRANSNGKFTVTNSRNGLTKSY